MCYFNLFTKKYLHKNYRLKNTFSIFAHCIVLKMSTYQNYDIMKHHVMPVLIIDNLGTNAIRLENKQKRADAWSQFIEQLKVEGRYIK